MIDVTSVSEHTRCEMTVIGFMIIYSLVAVVNTDVTAHGFEHYFLRDEVQLTPRFGYEV